MLSEKKCPNCKVSKNLTSFYRQSHGYASWCKDCIKERSRKQAESGYFVFRRDKIRMAEGRKSRKDRTLEEIDQARERRVCYEMHRNALNRSLRTGKSFDLTREWVESSVREFRKNNFGSLVKGSPFMPSLDRIDGRLGYIKTNVRVVWVIENLARNRFTEEQLIEFCKRKLGLQ